jgi:hypothetical protein
VKFVIRQFGSLVYKAEAFNAVGFHFELHIKLGIRNVIFKKLKRSTTS